MLQTSQAMDIIVGGEKSNALPESVKLLTNHRVAIESNVKEVFDHLPRVSLKLPIDTNLESKLETSLLLNPLGMVHSSSEMEAKAWMLPQAPQLMIMYGRTWLE